MLAFTLAEGAGSDWIVIAAVDGHHTSAALGTLAFAAFLAAMTTGPLVRPVAAAPLRPRRGAARARRSTGLAGTALFVFSPALPLAVAGTVLWGLGAALGFPVGMSAAAEDPTAPRAGSAWSPRSAIARSSPVPRCSACSATRSTVLRALTAIAVLFGFAALLAGVARPRPDQVPNARPRSGSEPATTGSSVRTRPRRPVDRV